MAKVKPAKVKPAKVKPAKLRSYNSWGAYVYEIAGEQLYDLYSVDIAGKKYAVGYVTHTETVYDMGHEYPAWSRRYYVQTKFAGVNIEVFLDELIAKRVKITALDYSVEKPKPKPRKKRVR